ncbi:MAG: amino acid permease [Erysipelotrichaceae bacterium]|nr:amino acid permease [Erysipelotrichaceae bacterium]
MNTQSKNKSLSILGAFSLSIGTAIGWGSFVITGSSFLSKGGPLGSIIGIVIGMLIMLVVAYNYHYMMNRYPNSNGGIYTYAKHALGGDHAFLVSWFLIITYAAILWANVSSFSLFARYIFGSTFQFGFHYVIGGYDIWLGEILLSLFFLLLFAGLCLIKRKITYGIQSGLALIFISLIIAGFIISSIMHKGGIDSYKPGFAPNGNNEFSQVIGVVGMMPWAFIGFENISHSSNNFKFRHRNVFKVLFASVVVSALIYILICQLSISVFPDEYSNWYEYLTSSSSLSGLDAIPAFYVMHRYLGIPGLVMFVIALLAIIMTSLIGNMLALSNLIHSMSEDGIFLPWFKKLDKNGNPINTIIFITLITSLMLFFGRVLISWIVDINTFCGVIVYTYISVIALAQSRKDRKSEGFASGILGIIFGVMFSIFVATNSFITADFLSRESLLIFVVWSLIGLGYYGLLMKKDKTRQFGHSMIALFGLFLLIVYSIGSWLFKIVSTANSIKDSEIVIGIVLGLSLIAMTQIVFFYVFYIIKKREVALQDKLVLGMATMVEGRDNSTGGHIKRTSDVVRFLVEEMIKDPLLNMDTSFYRHVIKAAPMHDLGKISVDDAILRKPGKFTPEEYSLMKAHAPNGAEIVNNILSDTMDKQFEQIAINVAHYHHERWDGKGYPNGLKGEEIPLEARIMAIADVYDALVSKRVYKEEFSFEEANDIIIKSMGKQFDPGLEKYYVRARERIENYYLEIRQKSLEQQ